ncbi:MAG: hypothetical protein ABI142_05325 [Bryocella sp.]
MRVADDLIRQGRLARFEGRTEEALGQYQQAAELYREEAAETQWAQAMRQVAALEVELKRGEDARRDIDAVLAYYQLRGYQRRQPEIFELANVTRVSALAAELCGEAERSKTLWKEAAELYAEARLLEGAIEAAREDAIHSHEPHDQDAFESAEDDSELPENVEQPPEYLATFQEPEEFIPEAQAHEA